jgi:ubiquinone/menaquinone biosynthesis C-methylase UbiE
MVIQPFEKCWSDYDEWYEKHRELYLSELKAVEIASRGIPRPWLEVGVGTGRFAVPLGIDTGVDPSDAMLAIVARRGLRTVKARGENLPFPSGSFGGVFIIITLCFLDNPVQALHEASRVLTPTGRLVLGFVPADSTWGYYYRELAKRGHKFYKYANLYTFNQVEELLETTEFESELYVSTLVRNKTGTPEILEEPIIGLHDDAGFIVILAHKSLSS